MSGIRCAITSTRRGRSGLVSKRSGKSSKTGRAVLPQGPGWHFATAPLDTPSEAFGPYADLVRIWRSRIPDGSEMPRRADFSFEDFRAWLGRIFIAKIERDPFNLRFTLWGTQLTEWWQVDYTNKTLGEQSSAPEMWKSTELTYFAAMDRSPFIGIASGFLTLHGRSDIRVIGLDLPCCDAEGRLDHVISAHLKIDAHEPVREVLGNCPLFDFPLSGFPDPGGK